MAERFEELNAAIDAMLAGGATPAVDNELRALLDVASALTFMPRPSFRERLRRELIEEQTVTPYLVTFEVDKLIDFIKNAFGAEEVLRATGSAGGVHCELRLGNTKLMVGGGLQGMEMPQALHVYVPDVDAAHRRAIEHGATELMPPGEREYGDRDSALRDSAGNHWYLGTHHGESYKPAGLLDVTPYFHPRGAAAMVEFLKRAMEAETIQRDEMSGVVVHAKLRVYGSVIEMGEAHGEFPPMTAMMHVLVRDVDDAYERAIAAGAKSIKPPATQPYGERVGGVEDEWGNQWFFAQPVPSPA